ncbi:MAG: hypothetical protein E7606_04405 [Ruminococcaceae bacterium]|nr:hypothetical protein [Oscillospiraceae bacterium]
MLYTVKNEGKKYAYDSTSGAVLPLNNLKFKMLNAIIPPISQASLTSLRYELAKFDSGEVSDVFNEILTLAKDGVIYAAEDGTVRLAASGDYACESEALAAVLLTLAFEGKETVSFEGDYTEVAKTIAATTGTTLL